MRIRRFGSSRWRASTVLTGARAAAARASAAYPIAIWAMDEPAGSRTMHDSSGHGLRRPDRRRGRARLRVDGARGYRFGRLEPDTPPTHPGHLVVVPDTPPLDPGTGDFAVTLRLRTTYQFGNIIQKGQATVAGGSWKLQIPNGHVQCWFRGSAGAVLVTAPGRSTTAAGTSSAASATADGVSLAIDGTHGGRPVRRDRADRQLVAAVDRRQDRVRPASRSAATTSRATSTT